MLNQMLTVMGPLMAFMLIPFWIPVLALVFGSLTDRVFPRTPSPVRATVEAAVARSGEARRRH